MDGSQCDLESVPAVDLKHLRRFTLGNVELEAEVLQLFIHETPAILRQMQFALDESGWRRGAHTLKGSARAIGAWPVADAAEAADKAGVWPDLVKREEIIARVGAAYEATVRFIRSA